MKYALYKRGYCIVHDSVVGVPRRGGGKRGKLTGKVSSASFRRLRAWCIQHDLSGECWGITLTVPGLDLLSIEDFKSIHHKLCVWCNDNDVPLVWRVELQQRGQPHLHCVLFGSCVLVFRLFQQWFKLLDSMPLVFSREFLDCKECDIVEISRAFLRGSSHAVDLQRLSGDFRAWRYLVAHMSKGKQAQLGFAGRNWGVCNRSLFTRLPFVNFDLSPAQFFAVRRWLRRLTKIKVFRGSAFMLGNPATVKTFIDYARKTL